TTLLLFSVSLRRHQPPRSPLFPYTTLFRARAVSLGSTTIISSARSCSPIKPKPNAWAIFPPPIKATRFGCVLIGGSDTFDIYQFPLDQFRNLYGLMLDLPKYYCPLGRNRG